MNTTITPFTLPLTRPLETAAGTIDHRRGFLVRVHDATATGIGEATPLPGWTESHDTCQTHLETAGHLLETHGPSAALNALADTPAARHGLSLALLDHTATTNHQPLYQHLGPRSDTVPTVPVNATIGDGPPDHTVAAATTHIDAGFQCLKIKVAARPLPDDLDRLDALTTVLPPDTRLRLDANGAWTPRTATRALTHLDTTTIDYVEQPLPPTDLEPTRRLRRHDIPIALDETLAHTPIRDIIRADAADVLILKPMVLGGVDRAHHAATTARHHGLDTVITTTIDGAIARTAAAHLAASLPDPRPAGLATADRLETDLAPDPTTLTDGTLTIPQTPGLGIDPDHLDGGE